MIRTIIPISELWQPTDYTGWPLYTVLLNAGSTVPRNVLFVGFRVTKNEHTRVSQFHKYETHSIFSPSWKCSSHRWIQPQMLRRNNQIKSISQCTLISVKAPCLTCFTLDCKQSKQFTSVGFALKLTFLFVQRFIV